MGKTHEDSVRELAAKNPYTQGEVHHRILEFKLALVPALGIMFNPGRYGAAEKLKIAWSLKKALPLLDEIPEPDLENCKYANSKRLVQIRDEFFEHLRFGDERLIALRTIINWAILMYEYDKPYRHLMDWWLEKIIYYWNMGLFLPREEGQPSRYWIEVL